MAVVLDLVACGCMIYMYAFVNIARELVWMCLSTFKGRPFVTEKKEGSRAVSVF